MHLAISCLLDETSHTDLHTEKTASSHSITDSKEIVPSNTMRHIAIFSTVLFFATQSVFAEDNFYRALQERNDSFLPPISPDPPQPQVSSSEPELSRTLSKPSRQITLPGQKSNTQATGTGSLWKTVGALIVVLALFLVGAKLWRKQIPAANIGLPNEAIEILGRKSIEPRLFVYLIRCGSRILVVGSSADGLRTLTEVTDPVEVDYLAGMCRRPDQENGFAQSLRTLFNRRSSFDSTPENVQKSFEEDADENQQTIGHLNIGPSPEYDQKTETVHA